MILLDIPANLVSATNSITSVPQALAYSFLIPQFVIVLVIIAFGIGYIRTKRIEIGTISAFLISLVMYKLAPSVISATLVTYLGVILFVMVLVALYLGSRKHKL